MNLLLFPPVVQMNQRYFLIDTFSASRGGLAYWSCSTQREGCAIQTAWHGWVGATCVEFWTTQRSRNFINPPKLLNLEQNVQPLENTQKEEKLKQKVQFSVHWDSFPVILFFLDSNNSFKSLSSVEDFLGKKWLKVCGPLSFLLQTKLGFVHLLYRTFPRLWTGGIRRTGVR